MPKSLKLLAKSLLYLLAGLSFIGVMIALAAAAFAGASVIGVSTAVAIACASFAVIIEGEVFSQAILSALSKILVGNRWLKHQLAKRTLHDLSKQQQDNQENIITAYKKLHQYLHELQEYEPDAKVTDAIIVYHIKKLWRKFIYLLPALRSAEENERRQKIANTKKQIAIIENFCIDILHGNADTHSDATTTKLLEQLPTNSALPSQHSANLYIIAGLTSLLGSGGFTFVIYGQILTSLSIIAPHLAIGTLLVASNIWGITVFAAMAYGYFTFNAILDMSKNSTMKNGFDLICNIKQHPYKSLATLCLLTMVIAATICTGGTAWKYAQAFHKIGFIIYATVSSTIGTLIINLDNAHKSGEEVSEIYTNVLNNPSLQSTSTGFSSKCSALLKYIWHAIAVPTDNKNIIQHWAHFPYKLIDTCWQLAIFTLHIASIGIMGDRFLSIPPFIATIVGTANEGWTDLHYIMEKAQGHSEHHEEEDHSHFVLDAISALIKIPLIPVVIICSGIDATASCLNKKPENRILGLSAFIEYTGKKLLQFFHLKKPQSMKKPESVELSADFDSLLSPHTTDSGTTSHHRINNGLAVASQQKNDHSLNGKKEGEGRPNQNSIHVDDERKNASSRFVSAQPSPSSHSPGQNWQPEWQLCASP